MTSVVTLQHTSVNSGTAVDLRAFNVRYAWKNIIKHNPQTGNKDVVEVDDAGMENPLIVIDGLIDTDDGASNVITQELLLDFANAPTANDITLTVWIDGEDGSSTVIKGRPSSGYNDTPPRTYTNTLKVWVDSFSININAKTTKDGRVWGYTIKLLETT